MTATWNGTTITDPVLIYQDEIISDNRDNVETDPPLDGTLICRHETLAQVGWHFANGQALSYTSTINHFRQRRTGTTTTPSVSRLTTNQEDQPLENVIANGLWTCRLDGAVSGAIPVGIYVRGGGKYSRLQAMHNILNWLFHFAGHLINQQQAFFQKYGHTYVYSCSLRYCTGKFYFHNVRWGVKS